MTRHVTMLTWDDAPHLSAQAKEELLQAIPIALRDARTKGIPQLGAGAIYPFPEEGFVIDPIELPAWWPRCFAMDVGWNKTAALWGAWDRDSDVVYLYSEHYAGHAEPVVHAAAIKARGAWIPGVIDPASRGRGQKDGEQLFKIYSDPEVGGLNIAVANNAVDAGLFEVERRITSGRIKVFKTLSNFLSEYRIYRRDDNGKIVKENDHLMDCWRYLCMSGLQRSATMPAGQWAETGMIPGAKPKHLIEYSPMDSMFDNPGTFI